MRYFGIFYFLHNYIILVVIMPRESYSVTVTFKPYFKYQTRMDMCKDPFIVFFTNISHKKDYTFVHSIEYHKYPPKHFKAGEDNPMAPHIHGILQVPEGLSQRELTNIYMEFTKEYGRTYIDLLPTEEDFDRWNQYIRKDVDKNNLRYPTIQHWKEYVNEKQ